ncbi:uroporphyrinogen-III C-methyltransferase [Hirschia litorea]|uniref:uroporphyrinogen-III C-methyltransferase n=1 Tax=Hirschia litorea TaxID=1199156 RepID=A0ABW2IIG0_9PROT
MMKSKGKLTLIGCGPGAADLLTMRAVSRIRSSDIVLYDRLVSQEVLELIPENIERAYVGKKPGDGGVQQGELNQLIQRSVLKGLKVSRLKSGDPMIFGRAAEEIAAASIVGAEVEIVPGVTAALAAASESVITVTERAELQSFIVTTGRAADADTSPDWAKIVRPGVCVAFYMGVAQAWKIQSNLMIAGVPADAPADWIENAGTDKMRNVKTVLGRLAHDTTEQKVQNPAILLIRYPYSLQNEARQKASMVSL